MIKYVVKLLLNKPFRLSCGLIFKYDYVYVATLLLSMTVKEL